jgi:hypothetical protein
MRFFAGVFPHIPALTAPRPDRVDPISGGSTQVDYTG